MKKLFIPAIAIALLSVPGCAKAQTTDTPASQTQPQAKPAKMITTTTNCRPTFNATIDPTQWADASNEFGLTMLRSTAPAKSAVLSSYSIERAMGMALEGACGDTASEIRKALSLPDADNLAQAGQQVETAALANRSENLIIDIDNHLWVEKKYTLLPEYLDRIKASYNATPETISFTSAPEDARTKINDYISNVTHNKIQNLLPQGSISSDTRSVLTNAIYFKAPWAADFKKDLTDKADFITADGPIKVDMMHHKSSHRVLQNEEYTAFDLDFKDSSYTMMIVLPNLAEGVSPIDALQKVESSLSAQSLRDARTNMKKFTVDLSMPKFKMEAGMAMRQLLAKLGVKAAFENSDFSGMTGNRDLMISDVYHKAFIEVDEEGAEAAAATAVVMMKRSAMPPMPPITINVDHPFLFSIIEKETGTALFLGRVTKI